jgi:hypothetical protein
MRGRCLIAALFIFVCLGAWSQEGVGPPEAETTDPIIIVVEDDGAVLIIGDDREEDKLPDIVFRNSSEYIGVDEDFVFEWGDAPRRQASGGLSGAIESLRVYNGVEYRSLILLETIFTPIEERLFVERDPVLETFLSIPSREKQVIGLHINVIYGAVASVIGIQGGLVNHVYDRLYGIQVGAANLSGGVTYGIRGAALLTTGQRHGGISVSGLFQRYTEDGTWGLMIGAFNQTESFTGLQIGVVNMSSRLRGVQIGALNFNRDGPLPFMLGINVGW